MTLYLGCVPVDQYNPRLGALVLCLGTTEAGRVGGRGNRPGRADCPRRLESKTANGISFQCCDASQPPSALRRARKRRSVQQALAAGACTHEPLRQ